VKDCTTITTNTSNVTRSNVALQSSDSEILGNKWQHETIECNEFVCQIDGLLRPGLTSLTWTSINLDRYFDHVKSGVDELSTFIYQVCRWRVHQLLLRGLELRSLCRQNAWDLCSSVPMSFTQNDHYFCDIFRGGGSASESTVWWRWWIGYHAEQEKPGM